MTYILLDSQGGGIKPGALHNAALICLARRKTDVLYARLRDHKHYTPAIPLAA